MTSEDFMVLGYKVTATHVEPTLSRLDSHVNGYDLSVSYNPTEKTGRREAQSKLSRLIEKVSNA